MYPSYKPSKVPWIGEIPNHWDVKKSKFLGKALIGVTYSPEDLSDEDNGILVLRSSNIQDGKPATDDCVYISKDIPPKLRTRKGDILICARNGSAALVGKNIYIDDKFIGVTFGAFMAVFRSPYSRFIYYYLNSDVFKAQTGLFQTSTINQLTNETLNNLEISIPPTIAEQNAVADYLDRRLRQIDSLIEKKSKLLVLLQEKRTALISQVVTKGLPPEEAKKHGLPVSPKMKPSGVDWLGEIPEHWDVTKLKYLFRFKSGGTPDTGNDLFWNGDIPWVSPKDMKSFYIENTQDYITPEAICSSAATLVPKDTLLMVVRSGILRHTIPVGITTKAMAINQDIKAFIPLRPNLNNIFWAYYILGKEAQLLELWKKSGTTVESIESDYALGTLLAVPPVKEQLAIANYLERETANLSKIIDKAETAIQLLQEYRSALITAAVTGKIDVREATQ